MVGGCFFAVLLFFNACDVTTKLEPDAPDTKTEQKEESVELKPTREHGQTFQREFATFPGAVRGHSNSSSAAVAGNSQLICARGVRGVS